MITHKEIHAKVNSKELTQAELVILDKFDKICNDKIESNFAGSDIVYVGVVTFNDIFRSNSVPAKRQNIIIQHLKDKAEKSGWHMEYIDEYYNITPL